MKKRATQAILTREPWHGEMCAQARKHRDDSVFVSQLGPEADAEVMIGNLRFMSFCAGYEMARLAERREILEWVELMIHENPETYSLAIDERKWWLAKLKAKLSEEK